MTRVIDDEVVTRESERENFPRQRDQGRFTMAKRVTTQELATRLDALEASIQVIAQGIATLQADAPAPAPTQREVVVQKTDMSSIAGKVPVHQVVRRREGAQVSATKWGEPVQMYVRTKADGKYGVAYCKLAEIDKFRSQPSFVTTVDKFKDGTSGIINP